MKVRVSSEPLQHMLRWTQYCLWAFALSLFAYSAFALLDSWSFQRRKSLELDWRVEAAGRLRAASPAVLPSIPPVVSEGGLVGKIEVPRLGLSAIIVDGTGAAQLRRGVGRISGTRLPGEGGNAAIAGHRDTFFRSLRGIAQQDLITVTTPYGTFRYRVVELRVVSPKDVSVLAAGSRETLTLVTCYPFYFVGAAPDRFIVRAERVI